ncbi:MAG TPA: hypothetical protein PKD12_23375 [Nitrospira sp.]|nr:hypothetical protein [Nitrospira sp.]
MPTVFAELPKSEGCRLIDFTDVEIRPGFLPNTYIVIVSGTKPYLNMTVNLVPLVYIRQPEFWGIEVVGCLPGIGLPAEAPYTVSLPLDGVRGSEGIEIIGATQSRKLRVGCNVKDNLALNALVNLKEEPPGLCVHGSIIVYHNDDRVEVTKAAPQGINPAILILNVTVIEGKGPMKGTPRHFSYAEGGEPVKRYTHVSARYGDGDMKTVEVQVFG